MSKVKLTAAQFRELAASLGERLTEELEREGQDCALPELGKDSSTDLWTPPKVDSKTVVKLSPTVKEFTGWRLEPTWIRKGGYPSIAEAVTHVVAQIKKHCVADPVPLKPKNDSAAVVSPI